MMYLKLKPWKKLKWQFEQNYSTKLNWVETSKLKRKRQLNFSHAEKFTLVSLKEVIKSAIWSERSWSVSTESKANVLYVLKMKNCHFNMKGIYSL